MTAHEMEIRSLLESSLHDQANILLEAGVSAREFVEIAKQSFVRAALKKYGNNGKPATTVDIVAHTELSRHDVRRLRARLAERVERQTAFRPTDESIVLMHWHVDEAYTGSDGRPRPLQAGPGPGSLLELIEASVSGVSASHMLARLRKRAYVSETDDGRLVPVRRNGIAEQNSDGIRVAFQTSIAPISKTIAHNVNSEKQERWIQRTVYSEPIVSTQMARVRRAVREKAAHLCVEIDDFLNAYSANPADSMAGEKPAKKQIGLGVFYFEDDVAD